MIVIHLEELDRNDTVKCNATRHPLLNDPGANQYSNSQARELWYLLQTDPNYRVASTKKRARKKEHQEEDSMLKWKRDPRTGLHAAARTATSAHRSLADRMESAEHTDWAQRTSLAGHIAKTGCKLCAPKEEPHYDCMPAGDEMNPFGEEMAPFVGDLGLVDE